ncbi:hypothetical protein L2E82_28809 [Cichorium intybus]|uniref:Uncharacterized protein n=1 Tax=Cichorium intybus TaxID=13427 RepID=A0ACB9CWN2_CICIN|nr:hypothetical protein L2E82_28809 [Cichorium intybus]
MDFKALKWQLVRGVLARRLILGTLCFAVAMFIVSFTRMAYEIGTNESIFVNFDKCSLDLNLNHYSHTKNLTRIVIEELMNKKMISLDSRTLSVSEGSDSDLLTLRELGIIHAFGVHRNQIDHELDFKTNSFDFILSRTFNNVPIPPLLVLEIERVLRPGGVSAMFVGFSTFNMGSLVRSATPVSLLLRSSEILHVCGIGSFALIVFKKRLENVAFFKDYKLPNECQSVSKNKPFMEHIEPLDQKLNKITYLPKFMNVSSRNRLIYINIGKDELEVNYPINRKEFNVFVVDYNVSAFSSYVKKRGVTFVYHPGLVEDDKNLAPSVDNGDYLEAPLHEERFEFVDWFKETAKDGDFVVLTMNAGVMHLKVLFELFESGAICRVDEMFIRCLDGVDCRNSRCKDCSSLFNGLRNAGVFVHRRTTVYSII